ncbi:ZBED5 protein, partial [Amia calva]|nr:ZBED5 protein [Amia calva]
MATRWNDTNYLSLGFTYIGKEEEPRPQCVVCCETLSNESMKPTHLRRHITTKHAILKLSAREMTGRHSVVVARIREVALDMKWMHCIRNPFTVDVTGIPKDLTCAEQEKLLEITSDDTLMSELKQLSLSLTTVGFLMPFATTYLCEKGFSALTAIKTKYHDKMDAEPDLRLKLTALIPDIARLSSAKQAHPSH